MNFFEIFYILQVATTQKLQRFAVNGCVVTSGCTAVHPKSVWFIFLFSFVQNPTGVLDYQDLNYREFIIPGSIKNSIYSSNTSIIRISILGIVVPKLSGNFFWDVIILIFEDPLYLHILKKDKYTQTLI